MSDKEKKSDHSASIVVAVIGVIGVIATALFSNWDKIFEPEPSGLGSGPAKSDNMFVTGAWLDAIADEWINVNGSSKGLLRASIVRRADSLYATFFSECKSCIVGPLRHRVDKENRGNVLFYDKGDKDIYIYRVKLVENDEMIITVDAFYFDGIGQDSEAQYILKKIVP